MTGSMRDEGMKRRWRLSEGKDGKGAEGEKKKESE